MAGSGFRVTHQFAAARRILAAAPMEVGDLLAELDELRGRHA